MTILRYPIRSVL